MKLHHVRLIFSGTLKDTQAELFIEAGNLLHGVVRDFDRAKFLVRGLDLVANAFVWEIQALVDSALKLETDVLRAAIAPGEARSISQLRLVFGKTHDCRWLIREATSRLERIGVPGPIFEDANGMLSARLSASPKTPLVKIEAVG